MRRSALVLLSAWLALTACSGPGQEFLGPWVGPSGERVGTDYRSDEGFTMDSYRGAEHCNWEAAVFLEVAWPPGSVFHAGDDSSETSITRVYVRDPNDVFDYDAGGFSSDAGLPYDAQSTGFKRGSWELWTSESSDGHIFLVSDDRVERWPRSETIGCD